MIAEVWCFKCEAPATTEFHTPTGSTAACDTHLLDLLPVRSETERAALVRERQLELGVADFTDFER